MDAEGRRKQVENADEFIKLNNWDVKKSEYLNLVDLLTRKIDPASTKPKQELVTR